MGKVRDKSLSDHLVHLPPSDVFVVNLQKFDIVVSNTELLRVRFQQKRQQVARGLKENLPDDAFSDEQDWLLPPLSLQLILENVFKHNALSEEDPLELRMERAGDQLKITNSFRPRNSGAPSTGIGQENLLMRYRLLEAPLPSFEQEGNWYIGHLPLIAPQHEHTHR